MTYTKLNRSAATLTKSRTEGSISPFSGMCVTCIDGCIGMCEIGKSAYRGPEVPPPALWHHHLSLRKRISDVSFSFQYHGNSSRCLRGRG